MTLNSLKYLNVYNNKLTLRMFISATVYSHIVILFWYHEKIYVLEWEIAKCGCVMNVEFRDFPRLCSRVVKQRSETLIAVERTLSEDGINSWQRCDPEIPQTRNGIKTGSFFSLSVRSHFWNYIFILAVNIYADILMWGKIKLLHYVDKCSHYCIKNHCK